MSAKPQTGRQVLFTTVPERFKATKEAAMCSVNSRLEVQDHGQQPDLSTQITLTGQTHLELLFKKFTLLVLIRKQDYYVMCLADIFTLV